MIHAAKRMTLWLSTVLLVLFAGGAMGQDFPNKPIRLIVPFPPGGSTDIVARIIAPTLAQELGQPVVIENRSGATGLVGSELVARAKPDGYTLLMATTSTHSISPHLMKTMPFDAVKDFVPVSNAALLPLILVVHPSVRANSVEELMALAKAKPGNLAYAWSGSGSSLHLAGVLLTTMGSVDLLHVPYKGAAPAVADLLGGQVSAMFDTIPSSLPHMKSGRLRGLAVTSTKRSPVIPDVPTVAESGLPGYEVVPWAGLLAPAGTPKEIVARLNEAMVKVLKLAETKERFLSQGAEPAPSTPEQFGALVKAEYEKWGKVVKDAGVQIN